LDFLIQIHHYSMNHELKSFLPLKNDSGKFYKITVSNQKINYNFRCYYDLDDLPNISPDQLYLNQWNEDAQKWYETELLDKNTTLHYIEIELRGDVIIRLGDNIGELLHVITYKYLPGITVTVCILIVIATATILSNSKFTKYFKEEYDLK